MKTKVFLTTILALTLGIIEWKMWHFFKYEFRAYNPSDEMVAAVFILWGVLAIVIAAIATMLIAHVWTPKKGGVNGEG